MNFENIGDYSEIILGVVLCAKIYCATTDSPTPEQTGTLYANIYNILEKVALIFGKMKK